MHEPAAVTCRSSQDSGRASPTADEFGAVAFARTSRAIEGYQKLGDRWEIEPPAILAVLDVAADVVIGTEAALNAVAHDLGLPVKGRLIDPLFKAVVGRPEIPPSLRADVANYQASLDDARRARNKYLHGEIPRISPSTLLSSIRDVIRLNLLLASTYDVLGRRWRNLADTLWRFDGQPIHFARQVRDAFSGKRFRDLPLRCFVSRFTGGSQFRLDGAFRIHSTIAQPRWEWSGDVQDLLTLVPRIGAAVGMIGPPEHGKARTTQGESTMEGTLRLVAHELDAMVDASLRDDNPFAARISLLPDDDRGWMVGPGELRLRRLDLKMPYRARVQWFLTPDGRQEVRSHFLEDYESVGSLDGELTFHYPGHQGRPAFRGVATLSGTTGPCRNGYQLADWTSVRTEPGMDLLRGWMWGDVLKMRFWCRLSLSVDFGEVEVFPG